MFEKNFPLKHVSHYKIGGEAKYFFDAKNVEDIIKATLKARELKEPIFVLAGASNILINDKGFEGLILKPNLQFIEREGDFIRVGAGVSMNQLVDESINHRLAGLEWAAGIPGTVGGAIYGNAGAFGKEMKNIVEKVVSLDISQKTPKIIERNNKDCFFDYRRSLFKADSFNKPEKKEIILEAVLKFEKDDPVATKEEIEKNMAYRAKNHPLEYPSLGSTFKNVPLTKINIDDRKIMEDLKKTVKTDPFPVVPAAYLISEAGLKGVSSGGAMISPKHPNFIVNVLDATALDVKKLIELAKNEVKKKFGVEMEEEIEYLP